MNRLFRCFAYFNVAAGQVVVSVVRSSRLSTSKSGYWRGRLYGPTALFFALRIARRLRLVRHDDSIRQVVFVGLKRIRFVIGYVAAIGILPPGIGALGQFGALPGVGRVGGDIVEFVRVGY